MTWRTRPLPPDWPATRLRILKRDRHRCYLCRAHATEVDHVRPAFEGGTDDDRNLAAICVRCHRRKSAQEGARARGARPTERRPTVRHPGLR